MRPVAVITARAGSTRLRHKNMLPIGGRPLAEWSILHALEAGLETVVTSDIPDLLEIARRHGARAVERPLHLTSSDCSHADTIRHALEATGTADRPCVLLQPSSPFRGDGIIARCLDEAARQPDATILSARSIHRLVIGGENTGHECLWDGCVAIYPPGMICDGSNVVAVENSHINSLQIDEESDYVQACLIASQMGPIRNPLAESDSSTCIAALRNAGIYGHVTLVARHDGLPIPQEHPVIWINHCQAWDGRRADVLFLIANPHLQKIGISQATRQVAAKAKLVIIRDNGTGEWLRRQLPVMCGKHVEIRCVSGALTNHLTTGAIASDLLHRVGCVVRRIGFDSASTRAGSARNNFNQPGVSHEIAILHQTGTDRKP